MASFPINNFLGTQAFGPLNVPQGVTQALLELDGTNMTNPLMRGSLSLDFSLDSGVTWASANPSIDTNPFPATMEFVGGVKSKDGVTPLPFYNLGSPIPHPELSTRRIRGSLTVSGVALSTTATLVTS